MVKGVLTDGDGIKLIAEEKCPRGRTLDLDRGDPIPFDHEAEIIAKIRAVWADDAPDDERSAQLTPTQPVMFRAIVRKGEAMPQPVCSDRLRHKGGGAQGD